MKKLLFTENRFSLEISINNNEDIKYIIKIDNKVISNPDEIEQIKDYAQKLINKFYNNNI